MEKFSDLPSRMAVGLGFEPDCLLPRASLSTHPTLQRGESLRPNHKMQRTYIPIPSLLMFKSWFWVVTSSTLWAPQWGTFCPSLRAGILPWGNKPILKNQQNKTPSKLNQNPARLLPMFCRDWTSLLWLVNLQRWWLQHFKVFWVLPWVWCAFPIATAANDCQHRGLNDALACGSQEVSSPTWASRG